MNKIRSLGRFRSVSAPFCAQVGSRTRPLVWRNRLLEPFWPKVTRQGTILGPPLDSKWLQNRTFEHRSALGPPNMTSGRGFRKQMENVWKIDAKIEAFWWLETTFGVIFFAYFTLSPFLKKVEKSMKKGTSKIIVGAERWPPPPGEVFGKRRTSRKRHRK